MPSTSNDHAAHHAAHHDPHPPTVDEQRDETARAGGVGPSLPAMPEPMTRGAGRGALIGAFVGALLLSPIAAIPFGGVEVGVRLLIVVMIGLVAGAAAGAVFFGGAVSELENPESDGDRDLVPEQVRKH